MRPWYLNRASSRRIPAAPSNLLISSSWHGVQGCAPEYDVYQPHAELCVSFIGLLTPGVLLQFRSLERRERNAKSIIETFRVINFVQIMYIYKQLDPSVQEYRVLLLKPGRKERGRRESKKRLIECELLHRQLAQVTQLSFKALSYYWGDPTARYRIRLGGAIHYVTQSLGSFLKRQRDESDMNQFLWVDAICINQDDDREKSYQIALMRNIYGAASELLIWLGDEEQPQSRGLKLLGYYGEIPEDTSIRPVRLKHTQRSEFKEILSRPWFDRLWIVQELLLGAFGDKVDTTYLISGSSRVPWTRVINCMQFLSRHNMEDREQFPNIEKILALETLRGIYASDPKRSLLWWIAKTRNRDATDARDKIYGVLALVTSSDALLTQIPTGYQISPARLYTEFAALALYLEGIGLALLRHCQCQKMPGLPSWVPDWSSRTKERPLWNFLDIEEADPIPKLDYMTIITEYAFIFKKIPAVPAHYQAGTNAPASLAIDDDRKTLTRRGIILGMIQESAVPFIDNLDRVWEDSTRFMLQVSHCKSMMESLPTRPNPYHSIEGRHNAFWRTILADHDGSQGYHPDLMAFNSWLSPIPASWDPIDPHISQIRSGRQRQVKLQAMLKQYNFADLPKRENRKIVDRPCTSSMPKAFKTPPRGMTPKGEKDLVIDNRDDPMWERLLALNPNITPESLTRFLEMRADIDLFDQARSRSVDEVEGSREDVLRKHSDLAETWLNGPHDLIKSPFGLPSVIPDPYSHERDALDVVFEVTELSPELRAVVFEGPQPHHEVKIMPGPSMYGSWAGKRCERYALGRRFFVTDGNLMGLGPPQAEVGDIVAVLFGSDVPFVLRQQEDKFRLIGEAHVQGIMDGEVIKWWNCKKPEERHVLDYPTALESLEERTFIIV